MNKADIEDNSITARTRITTLEIIDFFIIILPPLINIFSIFFQRNKQLLYCIRSALEICFAKRFITSLNLAKIQRILPKFYSRLAAILSAEMFACNCKIIALTTNAVVYCTYIFRQLFISQSIISFK